MKKVLLVLCLGLLFGGCEASKFYDNVGKPTYKVVKVGVKNSHISDATKERLKRIDDKATTYDGVRNIVKPQMGVISQ